MTDISASSLHDREAIRGLMDRYCMALFGADAGLLLSLYWPEAHEEHGQYSGPAAGFVEHLAPILRGRRSTVANLAYRRIELVSPTEATAFGFGHIFVVPGEGAGTGSALAATRYEDRLEKRDGEWRIIARKADMVARSEF